MVNLKRAGETKFNNLLWHSKAVSFSFNVIAHWCILQCAEWLKERADEIQDMSKIIWKMLFIKLPAIETINKQA